MPLLDERGRLFGRVNLIDAAVAGFVLLLIPLAYVGYLLFRSPAPVFTSVEPRTVNGVKGATLEVKGEHLRPYFRAMLDATPVEYLFSTPDNAVLRLPDLPAGSYTLTFYDEAQVVGQGGTISVVPQVAVRDEPRATVTLLGTFNRLRAHEAAALKAGMSLTVPLEPGANPKDTIELLAVQAPRQAAVPLVDNSPVQLVEVADRAQVVAVVRVIGRSIGNTLMFGDKRVVPGTELAVPIELVAPAPATGASPAGASADAASAAGTPPADAPAPGANPAGRTKSTLMFTVQKAYPGTVTPVDLRVRFITRPEILPTIQRDLHPGGSRDPFLMLQPQLLSLRVTQELDGGSRLEQREGRITILDAMLRVPATRSADGWAYDGKPLKPGIELFVDTPNWQMSGIVLSMDAGGK